MDDLLSIIGGGNASGKKFDPNVVDPSHLGKREYKTWFRGLAIVFGVLTFISLGSIFETIKLFRYVIYLGLIAFLIFYKNPRLMNPQPRLLLGLTVCVLIELICFLILGGF